MAEGTQFRENESDANRTKKLEEIRAVLDEFRTILDDFETRIDALETS